MQHSFTIKQELSFKDLLSATLYYFLTGRLLRPVFLVLGVASLAGIFSSFVAASNTITIKELLKGLAPIFIFLTVVFLICFFVCLRIYKTKPYLLTNVLYHFADWGITGKGEQTEFSKPWHEITKVKETRAFILFYIGNTDFHIIQKRLFPDAQTLKDFKQLLANNSKIKLRS